MRGRKSVAHIPSKAVHTQALRINQQCHNFNSDLLKCRTEIYGYYSIHRTQYDVHVLYRE